MKFCGLANHTVLKLSTIAMALLMIACALPNSEPKDVKVPEFPAEKALKDIVVAIAKDGGRPVGSAGHAAAKKYILSLMKSNDLQAVDGDSFEFPYSRKNIKFCNLLGKIPGRDPKASPILLAAHYDTCGPQAGADDNAAAIAILMTSIPMLRAAKLKHSVIFAFFDAEEPPHFLSDSMGSNWYYKHQRKGEVHCAIVLDLVGHDIKFPGHEDLLFVTGMESDPDLEKVFSFAADKSTAVRPIPSLTKYIGDMSDYHCFREDKRPYLFLSCGQWEHYHRKTDTPEKLNYKKMVGVGQLLNNMVVKADSFALAGPFEGHDTTQTEIQYFNKNAGGLLKALGVNLKTRKDLDGVAAILTSMLMGRG